MPVAMLISARSPRRGAPGARIAICVTLLLVAAAHAATRLLVTVTDPRTGESITDLEAGAFTVFDDKTPRTVETAELTSEPVDIMLLLDTSLVGEAVQPLAGNLIQQLDPKEQMAVISFASSADLVQDFTSSRGLLSDAVRKMKYGNTPQVLDALYASIDGGFGSSPFRRVVVLLTTGLEGGSSVSDKEVIRLARKNAVSIFPVYLAGSGRWLFDELARQTGGAGFRVGDLRHMKNPQPGPQIFAALRKHYLLTISGDEEPGPKLRVRVNGQDKLFASALPIE